MLGGYRAAGCRSHRASVATLSTCASPAIPNFAHVEARASGVFVHGRSPQARAGRGTCTWRLRPCAEPSRTPPAPTSGRSPQTSSTWRWVLLTTHHSLLMRVLQFAVLLFSPKTTQGHDHGDIKHSRLKRFLEQPQAVSLLHVASGIRKNRGQRCR